MIEMNTLKNSIAISAMCLLLISCSKDKGETNNNGNHVNTNTCVQGNDTLNSIESFNYSQSFLDSTWILHSIVELDSCDRINVEKEEWWINNISIVFFEDSLVDNTYNLFGTTINNEFKGNYSISSPNIISIELNEVSDLPNEPLDSTFYEILNHEPIRFYNTDTTLFLLNNINEILIFKL